MALIDTVAGREILQSLACWLAKRRGSRRLHRSFYIAFDEWKNTGAFSLETLENSLNAVDVQEVEDLNDLLVQLGCSDIGVYNGGNYYVNPTTGSDSTGDGSAERPYASLAFLNSPFFPRYIDHEIRILVEGDVSADEIVFDQKLGPGGSLSLIGVGGVVTETTSQGAGPFALTGIITYNTPIACYEFNVAETFGVDELYGKWIYFTTGDFAGQALPIHHNTASSIYTRAGWVGTPNINDQFRVVSIASTITCPKWTIKVDGPDWGASAPLTRFNIWNLNIDLSDSTNYRSFRIRNTVQSQISLVRLINEGSQFECIRIESDINRYYADDFAAPSLANSNVSNLNTPVGSGTNVGVMSYRTSFPPPTGGFSEVIIGNNAYVKGLDCIGRVGVYDQIQQINTCAIGQLRGYDFSSGGIYVSYVSGISANPAIVFNLSNLWEIDENYLATGSSVITVETGDIVLGQNTYGLGFTDYGISFGQHSARVSTNVSPTLCTGALGDIYFRGGVGVTVYPLSDAIVTDSLGNTFAYILTP